MQRLPYYRRRDNGADNVRTIIHCLTQLIFSRENDKYSDEDRDSLLNHLQTKRPRLMAVMQSFNVLGLDFLGIRTATEDVDPQVIASKMEQALSVEQAAAARDSCIWASLEWKWQRKLGD